jgi:hypothetical protein
MNAAESEHSQMRNVVMKIRVNLISALCLTAGFASSVAVAKPDAAPPAREAIDLRKPDGVQDRSHAKNPVN